MVRHRWETSKKGYKKCERCGLEVKAYKVQLGGLPKCKVTSDEEKFLSKTLRESTSEPCKYCYIFEEGTPKFLHCLACGKILDPKNGRILEISNG